MNTDVLLLQGYAAKRNPPGRHSFVMPEAVVKGELRPLRNPADDPD